jgi:hypothetical protein
VVFGNDCRYDWDHLFYKWLFIALLSEDYRGSPPRFSACLEQANVSKIFSDSGQQFVQEG